MTIIATPPPVAATRFGRTDVTTAAAGWSRRAVRVVLQAATLYLAMQAYRFVRTATEGDRTTALDNGRWLLDFERPFGLDVERGVQSVVLGRRQLVDAVNLFYVWGFWPTVTGTLIVLFFFARPLYREYRNALFLSGAVGLVFFAAFPVAPPRMLDGFVDTVHRFTDSTSIARPGAFTNEYAAMPSFHVGWMVLAGAAAMPLVRRRWLRPFLLLPATAMTFTVMATANHYLIDAVVGAALALGALAVARRLSSRAAEPGERRLVIARGSRPPLRLTIRRHGDRPEPALLRR